MARSPRFVSRLAMPLLLTALLVLGGAGTARAAGTSPTLMLTAVDTFTGPAGERVLTAAGAFNFDDLVQISFPAVGLMVVQGTRIARYEVNGDIVEATSQLVADGVALDELPAILQIGSSAIAPARLLHLNRDEVSVVLPADFTPGTALVLLYAKHGGEHFLSPTVAVVLP